MVNDAVVPINGKQVQEVYGELLGRVTFKWDLYSLPLYGFVFLTCKKYELHYQ